MHLLFVTLLILGGGSMGGWPFRCSRHVPMLVSRVYGVAGGSGGTVFPVAAGNQETACVDNSNQDSSEQADSQCGADNAIDAAAVDGDASAAASTITNPTPEPLLDESRLLPPAPDHSDDGNATTMRQISLGESVSLKELGPIIINADGTTRRIANWATLTPQEQESTWRLIGARNKRRLKVLKEEQDVERQARQDKQSAITEPKQT